MNNITYLLLIILLVLVHSNNIVKTYGKLDYILLICLITTIIYAYNSKNFNENLSIYTKSYKTLTNNTGGLESELISHDITKLKCQEHCDKNKQCKYFKLTNSNNLYSDFINKDHIITGPCTIYKSYDYDPNAVEVVDITGNITSFLYEKIIRLYILKYHPLKGLLFIPYTYDNNKLKALITKDNINCQEDDNTNDITVHCTNYDTWNTDNILKNDILDFRKSINPIELSTSKVVLEKSNNWIFGITFMISKKTKSEDNILLTGRVINNANETTLVNKLIYVNKDNKVIVLGKELLNANNIYTVLELDSTSKFPQKIKDKYQWITLVLENKSDKINVYCKTLYRENIQIFKLGENIIYPYDNIEIRTIGGYLENSFFGIIKSVIFSTLGINSNLEKLNCKKTPKEQCNNKFGCILNNDISNSNATCENLNNKDCIFSNPNPANVSDSALIYNKGLSDSLDEIKKDEVDITDSSNKCKENCFSKYSNIKYYGIQNNPDPGKKTCVCGNKLNSNVYKISNPPTMCNLDNEMSLYMKDENNLFSINAIFDILENQNIKYEEKKINELD